MSELGINLEQSDSTQQFELLSRGTSENKEYCYVRARTNIEAKRVVTLQDGRASELSVNNDGGTGIGLAIYNIDANDYGWVQIWGNGEVRARANCAANATLYAQSNANAGQVDDSAVSGSKPISGMALSSAAGGSGADTACYLFYPTIA